MPSCGYCRDCKWWAQFDENTGTCERLVEANTKAELGFYGESAELYTQSDFGCVQFEPKE